MSDFVDTYLDEYQQLRCPDCRDITPAGEWQDTFAGCEDCGEHSAVSCPHCFAIYDHVWGLDKLIEAQSG